MIKKYIALLVAREQPSTEMLYAVLEVVESMTPAQMSAILTLQHMRVAEYEQTLARLKVSV
jgi:hypothetical protein